MSDLSKEDVVRILVNLDTLSAGHIPEHRRAWAHLFIACGLIQKALPSPQKLTRERFLWLAGSVYDRIYGALADGKKGGN